MIELIVDFFTALWQPDGERRWVRVLVTILLVTALVATVFIVARQV